MLNEFGEFKRYITEWIKTNATPERDRALNILSNKLGEDSLEVVWKKIAEYPGNFKNEKSEIVEPPSWKKGGFRSAVHKRRRITIFRSTPDCMIIGEQFIEKYRGKGAMLSAYEWEPYFLIGNAVLSWLRTHVKQSLVSLDKKAETIRIRQNTYHVSVRSTQILETLLSAGSSYISGAILGGRPDKIIDQMPDQVQQIIDRNRKGYRIKPEYLSALTD